MARVLKNAVLLAAVSVGTTSVAFADGVPAYGGLGYDSDAGTGYSGQNLRSLSISAGTGVAVASGNSYSDGTFTGSGAERLTTAGAVPLGNLGVNSSGQQNSSAYAVNAAGTAAGYSELYTNGVDLGPRAVVWQAGSSTPTQLATDGTDSTGFGRALAYYVGPDGSAAGFSTLYVNGAQVGDRAVKWTASGQLVPLGDIGAGATFGRFPTVQTYVNAMNTAGTAAGTSNLVDANGNSLGTRAVRWDAAGTRRSWAPSARARPARPAGWRTRSTPPVDPSGPRPGTLRPALARAPGP